MIAFNLDLDQDNKVADQAPNCHVLCDINSVLVVSQKFPWQGSMSLITNLNTLPRLAIFMPR
jgi:hypothetical protein